MEVPILEQISVMIILHFCISWYFAIALYVDILNIMVLVRVYMPVLLYDAFASRTPVDLSRECQLNLWSIFIAYYHIIFAVVVLT